MKKLRMIVVALIAICAIFPIGCTEYYEYDVDTILEDVVLEYESAEPHKIEIVIPNNPYYNLTDDIQIEVEWHALGKHGAYYFTPGGWTDELMEELILVSEDGIRFAKDFLGIEVSRPLSFIFNVAEPAESHPFPRGGGAVFRTSTFISLEASVFPKLIVHEAVHAILRYDRRRSNFPRTPETSIGHGAMYLEEGLADMIDFLFALETEHRYYTNYRDRHLHTIAWEVLRFSNDFEDEARFGTRYPQLMSYPTAASFIYFLLEHGYGTFEDFMRVFDDIYLAEEVFGLRMERLVEEWRAYVEWLRYR